VSVAQLDDLVRAAVQLTRKSTSTAGACPAHGRCWVADHTARQVRRVAGDPTVGVALVNGAGLIRNACSPGTTRSVIRPPPSANFRGVCGRVVVGLH
jgi:hypothetical protein